MHLALQVDRTASWLHRMSVGLFRVKFIECQYLSSVNTDYLMTVTNKPTSWQLHFLALIAFNQSELMDDTLYSRVD